MAAPVITGITPNAGPSAGSTTVLIAGSGFTGATAVAFGSVNATGIIVGSDTLITATTPPGSGAVNVTVTTASGISAPGPGSQYSYAAPVAPVATPVATAPAAPTAGYFGNPALTSQLEASLLSIVQAAASPDALESQSILLRRLALEGDVVSSRVPPPKNITEIGGYFNLLGTLKESAMREQVLAGILGVAGPTQPLGWISNTPPPLAMVSIANDRPAGAAQPSLPLTVLVRSDFVAGLQAALKALHTFGATLPMTGPPSIVLPPGTPGAPVPASPLPYLGRVLMLAPAAALADPTVDPLVLVRPAGSPAATPYQIGANVLTATAATVVPANYDALECTPTGNSVASLTGVPVVPVAPLLAAAGFYPASPLPTPANSAQVTWAVLTNVTNLISGVTRLGDELSMLYAPGIVANSVYASMLTWIWNGTAFVSS